MTSNRVLVIDDDRSITHIIVSALSARGYDVKDAHDAKQGLQVAFNFLPNLILLDYMMPDKDGLTLLQELRAIPDFESIPIIMITATGHGRLVKQALEFKVSDFIIKPFWLNDLVERVNKWLPKPEKPADVVVEEKPAASQIIDNTDPEHPKPEPAE